MPWIVISIVGLILFSSSSSSWADSCAAIRSQMRAGASASSSEATQIRRQIAAIRASERGRGCSAAKTVAGGFFNACRGLAQRRAKAERQLAQASGGDPRLMARYERLGCKEGQRSGQKERIAKQDKPRSSGARYAGSALFYCVRPSDGYLFPAPHSQYARKGYTKTAVDQCRFICEDKSMALYVLEDPESEAHAMVSVETNKPYGDLPTAFRYMDGENFARCDWSQYFARVSELRARTVTPRNLSNAIIPIPRFRPEPDPEKVSSIGADEPARRRLRIVGATFLPGEDTELLAISQMQRERSQATTGPSVESNTND